MASVFAVLGPDSQTGIGGSLRAYYLLGFDPIVWALLASALAGILVSLCTAPLDASRIARYFEPAKAL
jgi:hypothetical protein